MTYYADVYPVGCSQWEMIKRYEAKVEAETRGQAIKKMRDIPGVLMVTNVREFSRGYLRWPEH